jgi:CRISPR-associated endoribonuclease Cas6
LEPDVTLYSCVVKLTATRDATLPQTHGDHAHAAFLSIVRATDPDLAQLLHDSGARKPFTVSPLRGLRKGDPSWSPDGQVRVKAGWDCWLRITLISEPMFAAFIRRFMLGDARPTLWIDPAEFAVTEVLTTPGSHPWAGYTTAQALMESAPRFAQDSVALEFASPFAFSLGKHQVEIMPRPELVFGTLAAKWKQWCGLPLPVLEREWLKENVLVAEWRMQSRMLRYRTGWQVGSVGSVRFRVFNADAAIHRALNGLAGFAFYAGVGHKTTQGMGQVRHLVEWSNSPVVEWSDSPIL